MIKLEFNCHFATMFATPNFAKIPCHYMLNVVLYLTLKLNMQSYLPYNNLHTITITPTVKKQGPVYQCFINKNVQISQTTLADCIIHHDEMCIEKYIIYFEKQN